MRSHSESRNTPPSTLNLLDEYEPPPVYALIKKMRATCPSAASQQSRWWGARSSWYKTGGHLSELARSGYKVNVPEN